MLSTRQGTITLAVISAIVAAAILIFAMERYRTSVDAKGKPETVLVANGVIQKGTSGDAIAAQRLFSPTRIVAKQASAGAIADAALLRGKVATATIYPGEQLTAADFVVGGGLAAQLAPNQRAVTVPMDSSHGLIGQAGPGDHVDVYAGWYANTNGGSSSHNGLLRLLIPDVLVLAETQGSGGGIGGGHSSGQGANITLQVDDSQAGELAFASDQGNLWLTLRPGNGSAPPPAVVTVNSILASTPTAPTSGGSK
jgi:pilus assembly protein CpaB